MSSIVPAVENHTVSPKPEHAQESTHNARRPHACQFPGCNKTFRRRFTMTEHAKTHSGEKTFLCSVRSCRKSFTTSGNLSRHKRAQHAWLDGPLECLVNNCGCKFSSEAKLERHMTMVHFDASSHSCPVKHCGCAFTTAGNLRRHMKQHHNDGSHQETATASSPSAVHQVGRFEPILDARWSLHRWHGNEACGPSGHFDADLMAVLVYFLDD